MNKVLLLLNALILVVNFTLAWASQDAQVDVMQTTARMGGHVRTGVTHDPSVEYLRLVHALEGSMSRAKLDAFAIDQMRAIHEALMNYRLSIEGGVARLLRHPEPGVPISKQHGEISRAAREQLEHSLRSTFRDEATIRQIATAIIRHAA